MKTAGFIGGGRITRILLNGFKNAGVHFDKINVFETNENVLKALKADYPDIGISGSNPSESASCDLVFLALHPPVLMETLNSIKDSIKKSALLVSLAPKITIAKMAQAIPDVRNLARMNPNAGTYVNQGFNPVCFAEGADKTTVNEFLGIFEKLGKVPVVNENQIEAYAMVSAMGHTYFWFQLQQLKELGQSYGLSEVEADQAITAMLEGTTGTLFNSGLNYNEVVDLVPVKPMAEHENTIKEYYKKSLNVIFEKIRPMQGI